LYVAWRLRPDLQTAFSDTLQGRLELLDWFFRETTPVPLMREIAQIWASRPCSQGSAGEISLPYALYVAWRLRPDLQTAFPDSSPGRKALKKWALHPDAAYLKQLLIRAGSIDRQPSDSGDHTVSEGPTFWEAAKGEDGEQGVNVLGYVTAATGLGEDARMGLAAMTAADIPAAGCNIPLPGRGIDRSYVGRLYETPPYRVNVLYEAAPFLSHTFDAIPTDWWLNKINIVSVAWELPKWPKRLLPLLTHADALWVPSLFTLTALRPVFDRSIERMPLPVAVPSLPTCFSRSRYGMQDDCFVFAYVFDYHSGFARKNPLAAIKAFQHAFRRTDNTVQLYLKCPALAGDPPSARALRETIGDDPRIVIVDRDMERKELLGFIASCDAYVSPHRSEGFGRTIAEAMLLGKPVIVTAFSGNLDFTTPQTAFLVDGSLVPVGGDAYPLSEGQYWCDPDLGELAAALKRCREDPAEAASKVAAGKRLLQEQFSPEAVGKAYRRYLETNLG